MDEGFETPRPDAAETAAMPYRPTEAAAHAGSLEAVVASNADRLLAIDGVEGCGAGQDDAGRPAVVVYLRDEQAAEHVPSEIGGYRVLPVITGAITSL